MTDDLRAEDGESPVVAARQSMPLEFEALYLNIQEPFHRYALLHLSTNDAAEEAVHEAMQEILKHWDALLEEGNLQARAWSVLRRVVISRLLPVALKEFREGLAGLEGESGLYKALYSLPPRQFDVVVLRYIQKFTTEDISYYMGVSPSTVDYHCRKAKERLERAVASNLKKEKEGDHT
ncbi:sigma-70 family RNA polymerase sigma factor [Streptomyces sp. NPDC005435]|uniref:RNA polymerase sigma factor n=1 Tax=Streptomyces sp. NPDC005435 TaxID=3154464 RepID=UPI0034553794